MSDGVTKPLHSDESGSRPGAQVLIVDDEPASASKIARIVGDLGYRPLVTASWTDALRLFTSDEIDLVLMDAVMPTVDGFKLTKILRSRSTSYVPIVFLTGLADRAAREQGVAVGADDFLTKPVDAFELKVRLAAMLRIRRLTQDLEAKTRALAKLAHVDALTGVSNRRAFDTRMPLELERSRRYASPMSLLMIDIDHFKAVNDTHGHGVGDAVLEFFGRLMSRIARSCDLTYRYGGEEFAIIAPETDAEEAVYLAERIRRAFELRSPEATRAGAQTLSIGVSSTELLPEISAPLLVGSADAALYAAKTDGRNRVVRFDPLRNVRSAA